MSTLALMNAEITKNCAVDYDTTAYRRSETGVAYGGNTWRVMLVIGLLSSVPPLARWRDCVPIQVCPLLIRTLSEVDSRKRYIPQQKSPRKGTSTVCPLGDGKSGGVAERFP